MKLNQKFKTAWKYTHPLGYWKDLDAHMQWKVQGTKMCNNKQMVKQQIHEQKTIKIGDLEGKEKIN